MADPINPIKPVDAGSGTSTPINQGAQGSFSSYMNKAAVSPAAPSAGGIRPIDLPAQTTSPNTVALNQMATKNRILAERMQTEVAGPLKRMNAVLTPEQKAQIAKNPDLARQFETLNSLAQEAGHATGQSPNTPYQTLDSSHLSLLDKGLAYVSNAEGQYDKAKVQISEMAKHPESTSPGAYLELQTKLYAGQQMVEYASILTANLTKAVSTLMNVQL